MAISTKGGVLANRAKQNDIAQAPKSVSAVFNELIDREGIRGRINEIMKERAPQFTASLVSLVNSSEIMQTVFREAPVTIIQSALKAATYDLPVDAALGFAYIVPFKNYKTGKMEAQFIMGYRGMLQLAFRTGVYEVINVTDVRETELVSYDRLTEKAEFQWIEDEEERNAKPIIGYAGFYQMKTGMSKTIYMSVKAIDAHEAKHRKGKNRSGVWNTDYEAMCTKTVLRKLIGKWGIMSIDYQNVSPAVLEMAKSAALGTLDDEDDNKVTVDVETGEIIRNPEPVQDNVPPEDIVIPFEE